MTSAFILKQAASVCHQGGVFAYPTESVYGLGCDPLSREAVQYLLQLKNRPVEKGLILIAGELQPLTPFINISQQQIDSILQAKQPTTWLVNKSALTPTWISGKHDKLAIRLTQHPLARDLCNSIGHAIVSTSANPAGKPPAKTQLMVQHYFGNAIDFIVPGDVGSLKKPTEIRDMNSGEVIRPGSGD